MCFHSVLDYHIEYPPPDRTKEGAFCTLWRPGSIRVVFHMTILPDRPFEWPHINCIPRLQLPIHRDKSITYQSFSCVSSAINVHVGVPRQGYCIGETVPANIVENGSNRQTALCQCYSRPHGDILDGRILLSKQNRLGHIVDDRTQ